MTEVLEKKEAKEVEPREAPLTVVDDIVFDGLGGFLAIEDRKRGLMKAYGGDRVVTLSDGSRHVVAKELHEASPLGLAKKAEEKKEEKK